MTVRRPLIRYHGGKWKLAPWLQTFFPAHRVYTEAFGGGASVLLRKPRSYGEVYNDLDGEVVNLFRVARDQGDELVRRIALTPFARVEFELSYEPDDDPVEQARRTVARAFMGFGSAAVCGETSGFRSNSNRSGTTPAHDWRNLPDCVVDVVERLRGVVIENRDALSLIAQHDAPSTLHYVDPPYVHSTRSEKTSATVTRKAYQHELNDNEHRDLAALLHRLEGFVVLSGYPSALYDDELFVDWHRVARPHFADGAIPRTEVVWLNPACAARLGQRSLFAEAAA